MQVYTFELSPTAKLIYKYPDSGLTKYPEESHEISIKHTDKEISNRKKWAGQWVDRAIAALESCKDIASSISVLPLQIDTSTRDPYVGTWPWMCMGVEQPGLLPYIENPTLLDSLDFTTIPHGVFLVMFEYESAEYVLIPTTVVLNEWHYHAEVWLLIRK